MVSASALNIPNMFYTTKHTNNKEFAQQAGGELEKNNFVSNMASVNFCYSVQHSVGDALWSARSVWLLDSLTLQDVKS